MEFTFTKVAKKTPNINQGMLKPKSAIFNADPEENNSKVYDFRDKNQVYSMLTEQSQISKQKMIQEASKLLVEDPNVYDYDEFYDDIAKRRGQIIEFKKEKGKSRYINDIVKTTEKRKREQSIVFEKMAEKELKREKNTFGDKERFVTASYKQMVEENKKFEEEDKIQEKYNKEHTIENKEDMSDFMKNMYSQNIFQSGFRPDLSQDIIQVQSKPTEKQLSNTQSTPLKQSTPEINSKKKERSRSRSIEKNKPTFVEQLVFKEKLTQDSSTTINQNIIQSTQQQQITIVEDVVNTNENQEKELTKEDKIRLAKERYLQRNKLKS